MVQPLLVSLIRLSGHAIYLYGGLSASKSQSISPRIRVTCTCSMHYLVIGTTVVWSYLTQYSVCVSSIRLSSEVPLRYKPAPCLNQ